MNIFMNIGRGSRLYASCPYHGYSDEYLILYFYNGLSDEDVRMVNVVLPSTKLQVQLRSSLKN